MNKKSFVLEALGILGLEEILKLSSVLLEKKVPLKRAAGEDLVIVSDDALGRGPSRGQEDNLLPFSSAQKVVGQKDHPKEEEPQSNQGESPFIESDLHLWQREASKDNGGSIQKTEAFKGYKQSTQLYVVKQESTDGKNKLKFASTNGVLVDKKQA